MMINISSREINLWADEIGITNPILAEQDLRLYNILEMIYTNSQLSNRLCFKGGSALNKLYFSQNNRLSVDLDFNIIGKNKQVYQEAKDVRKFISQALKNHDYDINFKYNKRQTSIYAHYTPLLGKEKQTLKIEMSTVENIPILGIVRKKLKKPGADKALLVTTYKLEELIATKLRALYGRFKGRDLYDLDLAQGYNMDTIALRRMTLFYFYRAKQIFNYSLLINNIKEKLKKVSFSEDLKSYLRPDIDFDIKKAAQRFIRYFSFLSEQTEREKGFILLAKYLLGKINSPRKISGIKDIECPIKYLMGNIPISQEAVEATLEDIKIAF